MKRLILIFGLLLCAFPVKAQIALVAHTVTQTTSSSINTTGATLLHICQVNNGAITTPTDSKSNTWTAGTLFSNSSQGVFVQGFYAFNPTVGSGHTFTNKSNTSFGGIFVTAWSGTLTTSGVFQSPDTGTVNSATSIQPGSITPAGVGQLLVSCFQGENAGTVSINDSFTILDSLSLGGVPARNAYLIDSSSSAINPTWTHPSGFAGANLMTFKPATTAGCTPELAAMGSGVCEEDFEPRVIEDRRT
jgi:hypothetical protein